MDLMEQSYQTELNRFAYHATGLQVLLTATRLQQLCGKAGFRPDQPRVPRGNADGGQWTRVPGWAGEDDARIIPVGGEFRRPSR